MPYFVSQLPDACATVVKRLFVICLTSVSLLSDKSKHGIKDTKNNGEKACCSDLFALFLQDMQILNRLRMNATRFKDGCESFKKLSLNELVENMDTYKVGI